MTIRELTIKEIRQTYKEHLRRDFPAEERKPLAMIERSYRRGDYLCLGAFEDGRMTGYAFFVFCGRNCLLDYYAVLPDLRGRGIGSEFLKRMTDTALTDRADILLIEVENPRYAAMEADFHCEKDDWISTSTAGSSIPAWKLTSSAWSIVCSSTR